MSESSQSPSGATPATDEIKGFFSDMEQIIGSMIEMTTEDESSAAAAKAELTRLISNAEADLDQPGVEEALSSNPALGVLSESSRVGEARTLIETAKKIPITDDSSKELWAGLLELIGIADENSCHDIMVGAPDREGRIVTTAHRAGIEALGEEETVIEIPGRSSEHAQKIIATLGRDQQIELRQEGHVAFVLDSETPGPDWRVEILAAGIDPEAPQDFIIKMSCPETRAALVEKAKRINTLSGYIPQPRESEITDSDVSESLRLARERAARGEEF